ncbi:MAG: DUF6629 family protein, partial [Bacteroidia bacterium]
PFAIIPLIFSAQQFTEGVLWLALRNPEHEAWKNSATYLFLFFAQVVWPSWVPLSILLLEKEAARIKQLKIFLTTGVLLSTYLAYRLLNFPVNAKIISHHIQYDIDFPYNWVAYSGIFYLLATVVPPFFSSIRKMSALGTIILMSFVLTKVFYYQYVISVWCFFAAVISVLILSIIKDLKQAANKPILYL